MQTEARELFTTVRAEGAILPADMLQRVAAQDGDVKGLTERDYHLVKGERLNEVITNSWNRLVGAWAWFSDARETIAEGDPGTSATRERWLLILFQELGYGRLQTTKAVELEGKSYPVSHGWGSVPIHLVGVNVKLDRLTRGVAGAATQSPHGLVQEFLNRSDEHLWGFVSNGLVLRILRDNTSLTRQAYVEFDLAGIMDGDIFADFAVLWMLCHHSRVEAKRPEECWLERWSQAAAEQGIRALEGLRHGVEDAIETLGRGFLARHANAALKHALRTGELSAQDYYRELLRLVYRLLFLFVAEDRDLLLDPKAGVEARGRYERFYSTQRLRKLAQRRRGTRHFDLWEALRLVMAKLGEEEGSPELGLPVLGSFLWSPEAAPHLDNAELANSDLLASVRSLAFTEQNRVLRAVDYKNLGSEELGSVYESLLELHPEVNLDAAAFALTTAAGHERKTTGSYYTPAILVSCLLDSALDPVLDEVASSDDPERAILGLKICDPATGSGHFLLAAAHRIAKRLASVRTGDDDSAPDAVHSALRDVIGRCLYGVDINPMAVELCKVSLWMEALEPGKPLSFLDAHIRCGNSLVSSTRRVREESGEGTLGHAERRGRMLEQWTAIDSGPDETIAEAKSKAAAFGAFSASPEVEAERAVADAWVAALATDKRTMAFDPALIVSADDVPEDVRRLARLHSAFHWDLEFPAVFAIDDAERTGFDVLIGNPPWVSYSGRQAVSLSDDLRRFYLRRYGTGGWLTSHGLFLLLAAVDLTRRSAGLVLPEQVAHLVGYESVREAAVEVMELDELRSWGEGIFTGVASPCLTLVVRARGGRWLIRGTSGGVIRTLEPADSDWSPGRPTVAKVAGVRKGWSLGDLVADIGVHTGNCSKKLIKKRAPQTHREVPVLEGKQINRYRCAAPQKTLDLAYEPDEGEYFTIRPVETYERTEFCIRQTAGFPIVGPRRGAAYFRNSLLALYPPDEGPLDVRFIVAVLNSLPMRIMYEAQVAEAHQRTFPQVKIRALRALPMPSIDFTSAAERGTHDELVMLVEELLEGAVEDEARFAQIDGIIDELAAALMGVALPARGDERPVVEETSLA